MGMRFQHHSVLITVASTTNGTADLYLSQVALEEEQVVATSFNPREWRTLSRHVEEALREAALLRRRAKSAERRKRDAMKGTR